MLMRMLGLSGPAGMGPFHESYTHICARVTNDQRLLGFSLLVLREIPLELREQSRGGQVNLDMEDHRDEDFLKPKVSFKAFGGEGQKLGR